MLAAMQTPLVREPFQRAVTEIAGRADGDLLILCDHASNAVPEAYGSLGLPEREFARHIAYDIGALAVARGLAEALDAHLIHTGFSRLLIDPNRGADDPTLVMRLSDGAVIPGNARADADEIARRTALFHAPYHAAIAAWIDRRLASGGVPVIVSMHSFTPAWKSRPRPWHAAVLWDRDPRLAVPLIAALAAQELLVGDNEPYDGALENDTLYTHATMRGLPHALIEVRQDLISGDEGVSRWIGLLESALAPLLEDPALARIEHFGSRATRGRTKNGD